MPRRREHDASVIERSPFAFDPVEAVKPAWPHQSELIAALLAANATHRPGDRQQYVVATGGGKRRIGNDVIAHLLSTGRGRVLVITKDWTLLRQAAEDLCRRHEGMRDRIGYVGASGRRCFPGIEGGATKSVVFTTIQSWNRHARLQVERFEYVVIDEVHWGEGKRSYQALLEAYATTTTFIGATATRRRGSRFRVIGEEYGFARLLEAGILAEPRIFPVQLTGVDWTPTLDVGSGDFTNGSLRELASSPERNALIVRTFLEHRAAFAKTIVFACSIEHARTLAGGLAAQGVRAEALHSELGDDEKEHILSAFREGACEVLVNVAMATHGLDIPDIRTVFLARPTRSDILFAQMLGRGSRRTSSKTFFNIVDFVDNVPRLGVPPIRPEGFLAASGVPTRSPRLERHVYESAEFITIPQVAGYEELHGLELNPHQTFGIEFELDHDPRRGPRPDYGPAARRLLEALSLLVPTASDLHDRHLDTKDLAVWNVEPDGSCGWEITSRILQGEAGFREVADAARVIEAAARELGLRVSHRTGTHVHLGWTAAYQPLRRLFEIGAYHEPALFSLVAPSRADNRYAGSLRRALRRLTRLRDLDAWASHFANSERRYLAVNPTNLFHGYGTVEVRLHSGTVEARKILTWISLWMRILDAAGSSSSLPRGSRGRPFEALSTGPDGDVRALGRFVGAGDALVERLVERRQFVVANSWVHDRLAGALARRLLAEWESFSREPRDVHTP
jgi:superfamily II DNA or RNA helicase